MILKRKQAPVSQLMRSKSLQNVTKEEVKRKLVRWIYCIKYRMKKFYFVCSLEYNCIVLI